MSNQPDKTNLFADRETGQVVRVNKVDEKYAYVTVLKTLPSSWAMPLADYEGHFSERYAPLDAGDASLPPEYRPPMNQSGWEQPVESDLDPSRGETPEGVRLTDAEQRAMDEGVFV